MLARFKPFRSSRHRALLSILLYGLVSGLLITILKLTEYRFLVVEHSLEIYGGLVATIFSALGIWLGLTLTRRKSNAFIGQWPGSASQPSSAAAPQGDPGQRSVTTPHDTPSPFSPDPLRLSQLRITPRELEILGLIASGLSNREIADRLFVSENTVKTHSSRLFDKLGARRRTQAVQLAKEARLIP